MDATQPMKINVRDQVLTPSVANALDIIVNSPMVTQLFAKALGQVLTKIVTGTISGIIIEFDNTVKRTQIELHHNQVTFRIRKLTVIAEEYAAAIYAAEQRAYPPRIQQKYIDGLYGMFEQEMGNAQIIRN